MAHSGLDYLLETVDTNRYRYLHTVVLLISTARPTSFDGEIGLRRGRDMVMSRMTRLSGDNLTLSKAEAQRFASSSLGLEDDLCYSLSGIALTQQREKCEKLFLGEM